MSTGHTEEELHDCRTSSSCTAIAESDKKDWHTKLLSIIWPKTASFGINPYRKGGGSKLKYYKCKKNRQHIAREYLGKWVRVRNFGISFFPKSPVNRVLPKVRHWLHSNSGVQVMLSDVGKRGGSYVNCWWEFNDMLWSECGPNWYWQWAPSCCTNSSCR